MPLSGSQSVLANARSSPGFGPFGRSAGFLNAIASARQEVREPAQHILGPAHIGSYAQQAKPLRSGPKTA